MVSNTGIAGQQIAQLAETYSSQIFWLLVFFGFTFMVIGRGMVPRVMATVSSREAQVAGDLDEGALHRLAAWGDPEVFEQRQETGAGRIAVALLVGVVDAKNEGSVVMPRPKPDEQRGPHSADVHVTGGTGSEAGADHGSQCAKPAILGEASPPTSRGSRTPRRPHCGKRSPRLRRPSLYGKIPPRTKHGRLAQR